MDEIATQVDISEHIYELAVMDEYDDDVDISPYDAFLMTARFIKTFTLPNTIPPKGEPHNHPNDIQKF